MTNIKEIKIKTEFIQLDSLLKLSGAVLTGGQAKQEIQKGKVCLNNEVCTMRGKKIYNGDTITYKGINYKIKAENFENTENRARKL